MTLTLAEIKRRMEQHRPYWGTVYAESGPLGARAATRLCSVEDVYAIIERMEALERVAEEARIVVSRERADETYGGDVGGLDDSLSALDKEAGS